VNLTDNIWRRLVRRCGWKRFSQLDKEIHRKFNEKLLLDLGTGPNRVKIIEKYNPSWLINLDFDKSFKPTIVDATCLPIKNSSVDAVRCASLNMSSNMKW
jgi:hypothetical protein